MRLLKEDCTGLVIDVQERLFPHMDHSGEMLGNILKLIAGLKILDVPVLYTEQYPKGLGPTLEQVKGALGDLIPLQKSAFSCCDEPRFRQEAAGTTRKSWIICGIEAHVCVLQTVIDMQEMELLPVVVADAISSRHPRDKEVALERMRREGAVITTCESVLFELARISGTPQFKSISQIVK